MKIISCRPHEGIFVCLACTLTVSHVLFFAARVLVLPLLLLLLSSRRVFFFRLLLVAGVWLLPSSLLFGIDKMDPPGPPFHAQLGDGPPQAVVDGDVPAVVGVGVWVTVPQHQAGLLDFRGSPAWSKVVSRLSLLS